MTSYVWKTGNGIFISSSNWTPTGVPGPGDAATISGGIVVTDPNALDVATLTLGRNTSLTLSSGGYLTSALTASAGAVLSDGNSAAFLTFDGAPGTTATAVVSSGGSILAGDAALTVGDIGSALLTVAAGGLVSAASKLDIGVNAGGKGDLFISGGSVSYGTTLYVGNTSGGSGYINVVSSGSLVGTAPPGGTSGGALIGVNAGAFGQVGVDGSGAILNTDGNPLVVGLNGQGFLVVSGGAVVETGTAIPDTRSIFPALAAGDHSGGSGQIVLMGSGSLLSAGGFVGIGRNGTGLLSVINSATLIGGDAQDSVEIGDANATGPTGADTGTALVNSGGMLSAVGNFIVGTDGGTGTLFVSSGGSVVANAQIGIGTGAATYGAGLGTAIVGPGGELEAGASPGDVPTGSSGIYLGGYAGAVGTLTVSGAGALATANGTRVNVGNKGDGTLDVFDGGTVLAGSTGSSYPAFQAGQSAGTIGTVVVSGAGAVISAAGEAIIGLAGSGILTVSAGGSFLAGSTNSALSTGLVIGEVSGSGEIVVTGSGALISAIGGVQVGAGGTAGLMISSGGTVIADNVAVGSGGAGGTLTLSGVGNAAATLEVSGDLSIGTSGRVVGSGTVDPDVTVISGAYDAAGQLLGGQVIDNGTIEPAAGSLVIGGPVDGTGSVKIDGGASVVFEQSVDTGAGDALSVGFTGPGGTLDIKDLSAFGAIVSGYQAGDTIAVYGVTVPPTYSQSGPNTVLTFQGGETLTLAGLFSAGSVDVENDPNPACYAVGTRVATPHGERAVEELAIGDAVLSASGHVRTIRWVGQRRYAGRFIAKNPGVRPVRIEAGALGEGLPRRDLVVSPKHAMLLDGVLVPAWALVNGTSIVQLAGVTEIDYRHLELDSHDVILAEGAPAETFVDDGSRGAFHNAHDYSRLYPDCDRSPARYCAERLEDGERLERIREAISQRAITAGRCFAG